MFVSFGNLTYVNPAAVTRFSWNNLVGAVRIELIAGEDVLVSKNNGETDEEAVDRVRLILSNALIGV